MSATGIMLSEQQADIVPAYHRLRQAMLDKLVSGDWTPGSRLPSERQLARDTGLCVGTVRKAFETMVHQGYLVRIQGKGTFVAENTINENEVRYYSIRKRLEAQDVTLSVRLLAKEETPLSALPPGFPPLAPSVTSLLRIRRLFMGGGDAGSARWHCPLVLTTSWFPLPLCADLREVSARELEKVSLYLLAEKYCGRAAARSEELLRAEAADPDTARFLELAPGTPVISALMLSFTARGLVQELRESHIRTEPFGLVRAHVPHAPAGAGAAQGAVREAEPRAGRNRRQGAGADIGRA